MSESIEDLMAKGVEHALTLGAHFAEAKGEDTTQRSLEVINGGVRTVSESRNLGIGIRVYHKKGNGFSFSNVLNIEDIRKTAEIAFKIARVSSKKSLLKLDLKEVKPTIDKKIMNVKEHPKDVALDEKKDFCLRECKASSGFSKQIANVTARFAEYYGTIYFLNSEGTKVSYEPLLVGLAASCIAKKGTTILDARDVYGGSCGLEAYKQEEHTPEKLGENAAKWAIEKLNAKPAPAGKFPALIDPQLAGVLAHESFGHMSEADGVIMGFSPLARRMGEKLGPDNVTIIDEGLPKEGGYQIFFDDEGVPCKRVEILKNGILTNYLHSRATAHRLKMEPTGNARSQDYSFDPIVRMRNTYFEKGNWKKEEALKELKQGIYAIDTSGGQADATGTFLFKAVRGYWVENGEIKYPLLDVALTGNILEFLKNVDAVCDDLTISTGPFGGCGKRDQRAYVGDGGPHMRVKEVLFGGTGK